MTTAAIRKLLDRPEAEAAFARFAGPGPQSQLGYDAINAKGRRRAPSGKLLQEERELMETQRRMLVSGTRDVRRNFSVLGWALRRHLDFVSSFAFKARTKDKGFNKEWERAVEDWSKPKNFDAGGRHSRQRYMRLKEACASIDGDVLSVKINDGTMQAIEGDRCRNPIGEMDLIPDPALEGVVPKGMLQGVQIDARGRALAYAIHRRTLWAGFEFERMVPASDVIFHGYFDRYDQVRGISPVAAALNSFQDLYEGIDYALLKIKVSQLFGLVFTRKADDSPGAVTAPASPDNEGNPVTGYQVDLGQAPFQIDLEPGDDAKFLDNPTPSTETKEFLQVVTAIAIKAFDLPFSMYDEGYTNFYGSRAGFMLYLKSCRFKRALLRVIHEEWNLWRTSLAVARRELKLPSGWTVDDLAQLWVPDGTPWWDPEKDIDADMKAVAGGFKTIAEVRLEHFGDDLEDLFDRRAEELQSARDKKVPLYVPSTVLPIADPNAPAAAPGQLPQQAPAADPRGDKGGEKPAPEGKEDARAQS